MVEETTEILVKAPTSLAHRDACLVHIYPTGAGIGTRYPLAEAPLTVGRGADCAIRIDDHSLSRQHARLQREGDGHYVVDLESTNGTLVNDVPVRRRRLQDGDYLHVGNCIFRFLAGGNVEADYHEEIHRLAVIDALTDLPNKRCFLEFLERELARSARHQRPLALVLFDLDRFKAINDEHGHLGGDAVLRELAGRLKLLVRREELLARYGGEEFAAVLPESTRDQARTMAERLRALVEGQPFRFEDKSFAVTISLGLAATTGAEPAGVSVLIQQADAHLYQAKREGRNRVVG